MVMQLCIPQTMIMVLSLGSHRHKPVPIINGNREESLSCKKNKNSVSTAARDFMVTAGNVSEKRERTLSV